jgi:D-tyrosyl-tRNA(Tyr) deacylase
VRAVVQRVSRAAVDVDGVRVGAIERGLLVLLGVMQGDTDADLAYIVQKTAGLRVFPDEDGRMNRDVGVAGGALLVVSQFTLAGDCRQGRRPSFIAAADPDEARRRYEAAVADWRTLGLHVAHGTFQAHMDVSLVNDGPVTILLDSRRTF